MSVVVLGMEMPNRCFECPVIDTEDGFWCSVTNKSLRKEHGINLTRPKWCPLRPLPEKHGRLIDLSGLETMRFSDGINEAGKLYVPFSEVAENIFNSKTIVEAEG